MDILLFGFLPFGGLLLAAPELESLVHDHTLTVVQITVVRRRGYLVQRRGLVTALRPGQRRTRLTPLSVARAPHGRVAAADAPEGGGRPEDGLGARAVHELPLQLLERVEEAGQVQDPAPSLEVRDAEAAPNAGEAGPQGVEVGGGRRFPAVSVIVVELADLLGGHEAVENAVDRVELLDTESTPTPVQSKLGGVQSIVSHEVRHVEAGLRRQGRGSALWRRALPFLFNFGVNRDGPHDLVPVDFVGPFVAAAAGHCVVSLDGEDAAVVLY